MCVVPVIALLDWRVALTREKGWELARKESKAAPGPRAPRGPASPLTERWPNRCAVSRPVGPRQAPVSPENSSAADELHDVLVPYILQKWLCAFQSTLVTSITCIVTESLSKRTHSVGSGPALTGEQTRRPRGQAFRSWGGHGDRVGLAPSVASCPGAAPASGAPCPQPALPGAVLAPCSERGSSRTGAPHSGTGLLACSELP